MDNQSIIKTNIISKSKLLCSCSAYLVTLPGEEGYFGVLAMHVPLIANLKSGIIEIHINNEIKLYFIDSGIVNIHSNTVEIITDYAVNLKDIISINSSISMYKDLLYKATDTEYVKYLENLIHKNEKALEYIK